MKISVIDNGGQWTHREYRVLRDLGVEARMVPNTTLLEELDADGIVLSGGAASLEGTSAPLGEEGNYLDRASVPILGICVGHQFMAIHFGGDVQKASRPEFGRITLEVDEAASPIFKGVPRTFNAWASHNDEVQRLPEGFSLVAHSSSCQVEAMAHMKRPLFGLQFHPEVEHTEHGESIFQNFVSLCHR
jgi:GMP synthase (glutamine-hydrolysing)